jgi:hypothetical protein
MADKKVPGKQVPHGPVVTIPSGEAWYKHLTSNSWVTIGPDHTLGPHAIQHAIHVADEVQAVNDHTCPTCKNDRCSKTEKSCWKCGSNL